MDNENELKRIKDHLEKKNQEKNRLLGQKEMLMNSLKELGFNSIKDAEVELEKLTKKIESEKTKYQEGKELFISKYKDLIEL